MAAQSNAERQQALRARRAMLGLTEVRGVYLLPEMHADLKAYAQKLASKAQKRGSDTAGSRITPIG
jgi:predicted RNA-binding protein YlxR (DUF448 family)